MPRNLEKRVEILFPIEQEELKEEVVHILETELLDNVKAHILQPDNTYIKADRRGRAALSSQDYFVKEAEKKPEKKKRRKQPGLYTGRACGVRKIQKKLRICW